MAVQQVLARHDSLVRNNKCMRCWYKKERCICSRMSTIDIPHHVIVLLHSKEYARLSNTGKIIAASCPDSTVLIAGIKEHQAILEELVRDSPYPVCVLFPTQDAISVPELLARHPATEGQQPVSKRRRLDQEATTLATTASPAVDDGRHLQAAVRPFTIIIIDGTWHQARHVVRYVPDTVPRVKVDPTSPSLFVLRTVRSSSFGFLAFSKFLRRRSKRRRTGSAR